jgi:hypothetical protein
MLYTRSSFIKWLIDIKACTVTPLPNNDNVVVVKNGPAKAYMYMTKNIDYEEIYVLYNKLWIDGLPGESELEKAE